MAVQLTRCIFEVESGSKSQWTPHFKLYALSSFLQSNEYRRP